MSVSRGLEHLLQEFSLMLKQWIGMFFVTGLIAMIITAIVVSLVWNKERKRIRDEAKAAGVVVHLESDDGIDVYAIEGCGYCVVLLIVIVLSALGITLPIVLSEAMEDAIMLTILIIFGAACWAITMWSPYYLRNERRRFHLLLENALKKKE